jgi:hypothetical protein
VQKGNWLWCLIYWYSDTIRAKGVQGKGQKGKKQKKKEQAQAAQVRKKEQAQAAQVKEPRVASDLGALCIWTLTWVVFYSDGLDRLCCILVFCTNAICSCWVLSESPTMDESDTNQDIEIVYNHSRAIDTRQTSFLAREYFCKCHWISLVNCCMRRLGVQNLYTMKIIERSVIKGLVVANC